MKEMKDFIYLDIDSVSSISAQLFEGNITELIDEKAVQRGNNIKDNYGSDESKSTGAKAGLNGTGVKGEKTNKTFEDKSIEFFNNDTFKTGVKKAYDDFLYNKIFKELENQQNFFEIEKSNQFDFIKIDDTYTVLDIHTSSRIFDTDLLRQVPFIEGNYELPKIKNLENKYIAAEKYLNNPGSNKFPKNFFDNDEELRNFCETFQGTTMVKTFNEMTKHLASVLGDKIIFNKNNEILIGDRKNLRIPAETLSMADEVTIKGFGRKITKTKQLSSVTDMNNMSFDNKEFLSKGTQGMLMMFLTMVLSLNENDTFDIIQPIGLEFSKVPR
ncbi:DUF6414 family protein [Staphylococcus saprophyticus]|uniref:DUF6414 family protein n=1 Tax=Staphylococcus saprophyticus TaxID=29385 RepID=UPI0036E503CC